MKREYIVPRILGVKVIVPHLLSGSDGKIDITNGIIDVTTTQGLSNSEGIEAKKALRDVNLWEDDDEKAK